MIVSDEAKEFLKKSLQYSSEKGRLNWRDGWTNAVTMKFRHGFLGTVLVVHTDGAGFGDLPAASVCWFLEKGEWPEFGVCFKDRKGELLRWSNLKKQGKREYEKLTRKVVDAEMLERVLVLLQEIVNEKVRGLAEKDESFVNIVDREMRLMNEIEGVLLG